MVVIGLVQELLGLLNGLLGHFVTGTITTPPTLSQDYEWFVGAAPASALTTKGNYLMGAVADIATYGAILVDWLVQALLTTPSNVNTPPPA
jgi:hypothetical protein